jgi:hypothetical protein
MFRLVVTVKRGTASNLPGVNMRMQRSTPHGLRRRQIRGDGHVLGALDEIPKPVVVPLRGRAVVVMKMIISRFHTPLNSSRTIGSVRRRDDNSRGKVQNVRGDSSAGGSSRRLFEFLTHQKGRFLGQEEELNRPEQAVSDRNGEPL